MPGKTDRLKAEALFARADKSEERGESRSAFRMMLAAAKLEESGAQVNVGNYYDDGKVVRRNRAAALYWYKRAYRRGEAAAAHNLGILWHNENNYRRALEWFHRAIELGDDGSNLEVGKHFLHGENNPKKAILYFRRVVESDHVCVADSEEASKLIAESKKRLGRRPARA